MGGEHTERERETCPERGSAIKGNSVGGAFALPTPRVASVHLLLVVMPSSGYQASVRLVTATVKEVYL